MPPFTLEALTAFEAHLTPEELALRARVRSFVEAELMPRVAEGFELARFPREVLPGLGALGILGGTLKEVGCPGLGAVAYGLVMQELERADTAFRGYASVQSSLVMQAIATFGSEAQRSKYLPRLARAEITGCFALTEAQGGSDPAGMQTMARRTTEGYRLMGRKVWITNAPLADLALIWARTDDGGPESVRGYLVEVPVEGLRVLPVPPRMSLRLSAVADLELEGCLVAEDAVLPGKTGLGAPLSCLVKARTGLGWGVTGAAKACFEHTLFMLEGRAGFGVPLLGKQLVQGELADLAAGIARCDIMNLHFGRLLERQGKLDPVQVSLWKRENVATCLGVARRCRALLGGNGVLVEHQVIRHLLNLESVLTYEGTHEMHSLILGKALTGVSAF